MPADETDRLLSALELTSGSTRDLDAALCTQAVDRAVLRFQRQKAGLDPWDAMTALEAARRAWERAHAAVREAA